MAKNCSFVAEGVKTIKKTSWKLIVNYEGEKVKDLKAKKGDLEIIEFGVSEINLEVNGEDVTDLVTDKRRKKIRSIVDEAMSDIKSDFEMDKWTRNNK